MAILREADPRIGCLAIPLSALGGFIVFTLVAAAVGLGAGVSGVVGLVGAVVGVAVAIRMLRRGGERPV
ncbi:MAG: hypothetical protein ACR2PK_15520 [Acidimicrobiales bacterium]